MNLDQLLHEMLRLPAPERARLAALLWDSLDAPAGAGVSGSALALAARKDAEIESGGVKPLTHQELMSSLRP